jgi:hypothetical protein
MSMGLGPMTWASSKSVGGITEVAVLSPIKKGRVPNERRTYEERARTLIATIDKRAQQGIPTELDAVATIHFGEIIVLRPEQYLVYSDVQGISYEPSPDDSIPLAIDDYQLITSAAWRSAQAARPGAVRRKPRAASGLPEFRTFLLTIVFFDGDLKAYFKDIAITSKTRFDQIFENCEDYPQAGTADFEGFWNWIRRYQVSVDLFAPRYPELSVVRIKQLEEFKRRFDGFVSRVRPVTGVRGHAIDDLFDEFLRENEQYEKNFPGPGGVFDPEKD